MIRTAQWVARSSPLLLALAMHPAVPADFVEPDLMQRQPWEACQYCHGHDGAIDSTTVPAIAGQSAGYIRKQLADFRDGRRHAPERQMSSVVLLLDPKDDAAVAEYYARQPAAIRHSPDPDRIDEGLDLYWLGNSRQSPCVTCHGAATTPMQGIQPKLFGLNRYYLAAQLRAFRAGTRNNDRGAIMRTQAAHLTDQQIEQVADYLSAN
jgi:cytochrome c553